jgi:hypothetical protein
MFRHNCYKFSDASRFGHDLLRAAQRASIGSSNGPTKWAPHKFPHDAHAEHPPNRSPKFTSKRKAHHQPIDHQTNQMPNIKAHASSFAQTVCPPKLSANEQAFSLPDVPAVSGSKSFSHDACPKCAQYVAHNR